nr:MAG TPA: hypothetical protein [Caudoviricetes sp.]
MLIIFIVFTNLSIRISIPKTIQYSIPSLIKRNVCRISKYRIFVINESFFTSKWVYFCMHFLNLT